MIDWIAGNWAKPWKCLVDHDGVFDIRLMAYSTDIPGFQQAQNDATTWDHPEAVEKFNPIDHVADWTVPILVVHSGTDDRVPLDQGMGAYGAAQLRHVPERTSLFPRREPLGPQAAEFGDVVRHRRGLDEALARRLTVAARRPVTPADDHIGRN